jgi:ribosome maturation factor RimP
VDVAAEAQVRREEGGMAAVDAVRRLAAEAASASGLVVEDVAVQAAGRRRVVRVVVDLPDDALGGVPMEAVAAVSQALSQSLDDADAMGGSAYTLEVSSPGVDRPLFQRRHWARARTRLVRVALRDGRARVGRLTAVDDEGVVVDGARLAWDEVARGKVEVEFSRADHPTGTDDADDPFAGEESEEEEEGGEA